jgi:uncharacterized protein (TIGR03435 family)
MGRSWLAIGLIALGAMIVSGQTVRRPQSFEAAMFRMEDLHSTVNYNRPDAPNQNQKYPSNRMVEFHIMLKSLMSQAWGVPYQNILGGPAWIDSQHYDLSAKVEGDARLTKEQMRPMLRNLLEQRLRLSVHAERRIVPGYALVVAKGGSKMKRNTGAPFAGMDTGFEFRFQKAPVSTLAGMIEYAVKKPVVDKTGLAGDYDFHLIFTRPDVATDVPHPNYGSIFTALQEQLGLRLTQWKVPGDYLVIEHVERAPSEN